MSGSAPALATGLSPPTRGIRNGDEAHSGKGRSIPAYAGDPILSTRAFTSSRVYPRLRGGSYYRVSVWAHNPGLSPPTRGIHYLNAIARDIGGSIPAYAGDPNRAAALLRPVKVYPRLRGGSKPRIAVQHNRGGLSPPTRGILYPNSVTGGKPRSIPAYAGDPRSHLGLSIILPVYPRLRGGSYLGNSRSIVSSGLSPPTRGIPPNPVKPNKVKGLSPPTRGIPYGNPH